jgi:uridine kinase
MPLPHPIVIGVAGGSASGKTTVVHAIVGGLGTDQVTVLQHDAYYRDRSAIPEAERGRINYDHPDALETDLLVRHLRELRAGRPVAVPVYDYTSHTRGTGTRPALPRRVVILEGILILAEPALRDLMDIRIYVDADADIRLIRRLERDIHERDRSLESVVRQYLDTVQPMHLEFVEPSKRHAHVIIPGGGRNRVAVDMLLAKIRAILAEAGTPGGGPGPAA